MDNKIFLPLILLISCLLNSCSPIESETTHKRYDYPDIVDFSIDFEEIFTQKDSIYFVFIYSLKCLHCELIKSDVIEYALSNYVPTYFIEYDLKIPVVDDVSYTIGAKKVEDLAILGTPTLYLINDYELVLNVAGMDLIKSILNEYI